MSRGSKFCSGGPSSAVEPFLKENSSSLLNWFVPPFQLNVEGKKVKIKFTPARDITQRDFDP